MIRFMDCFSDFIIKWIYNPTMFFGILWFILDRSVCQYDYWIHPILFLAGVLTVSHMQEFLPKRHPDLEYLEDESDEK